MDNLSTFNFPKNGIECYHFTSSVDNALDILTYHHLLGSLPSKVNDPDDLKITVANLYASPLLKTFPNIFSKQSVEENVNRVLSSKVFMDRIYRFLCLAVASKVDGDPRSTLRFWENYADHFNGVRLKFQVDQDFLVMPRPIETFCQRISYTGRVAKIDAAKIKNISDIRKLIMPESMLRDICYSKSEKWASEYELRLGCTYSHLQLSMSRVTSKEERFFVFDPLKLKEVVIGYRARIEDIGLLKLMTQILGIPLRMAVTKAVTGICYVTI